MGHREDSIKSTFQTLDDLSRAISSLINGGSLYNPTEQNDVTSSRVFGTNYQNTTGKPLFVSVVGLSTISGGPMVSYSSISDSPTLVVSRAGGGVFSAGGVRGSSFFCVIPNYYYRVDATNITLDNWIEWS